MTSRKTAAMETTVYMDGRHIAKCYWQPQMSKNKTVMNIDCFIQTFKRHVHCLSSSGSYKLWLSETGTLQFK